MRKIFRSILLVLMSLMLVTLCACPVPIGPNNTTTNNTGSSNTGSSGSGSGSTPVDPTIPVGATYRPSDTGERAAYWKKLSAPAGSFAASAYTNAASGLTNESATPTAGTDLAYGFAVPHDGNYEVGADMLALAAADGEVTLAVYKNGAKIWPVSEDTYTATTENGAARFTATTSAKKGDVIYIRTSGNTVLNISPRVTLVSGGYDESRDIEKNFPTVGVLSDVGSTIGATDFVMTPVTEPADGMMLASNKVGNRLLRRQIVAGEVIFVSDDGDVEIDATGREGVFDGKGATIVTSGRVVFIGLDADTEITNLNIIADGGILFTTSLGGTLSNSRLKGPVAVEKSASAMNISSCRIEASGTALENKSASLTLTGCYLQGTSAAIVDTGAGNSLFYDCILSGDHTAVILGASDSTVRRSTVYGDIVTEEGLENLLVAECVMKNIGAILYNNTHNSVILFNEVENVAVKNATNAYVAENAIYGGLLFDNVRYMIAEDNALATAVPALVSVRDYNGDNVTDITAREEVGVNEDLLPHINMDAFVNMERKTVVRDALAQQVSIQTYLKNRLNAGDARVIVAPGAYAADGDLYVNGIKNAAIYGYGVLFERTFPTVGSFFFNSCENLAVYGMFFGQDQSSALQLVVLEKRGNNKVLCVEAAGTRHAEWDDVVEMAYRWDEKHPFGADFVSIHAENSYDETTRLWTMSYSAENYEQIEVGDVITCRDGHSVMRITKCSSVFFEDCTVWGGAVRCFWDESCYEGTILHRVADVPRAAEVIDKATYDRYVALAEQYGLPANYLVYIDEFGNLRGMNCRTATADGTHSSDSYTGFTVTSCIFSGLSDDGSNHQGWFDRLYSYDEETGILTYRYDQQAGIGNTDKLRPFKKGERVVVFTSTGRLLVDTVALEDGTRNISGNFATVKIDKTLLREADLAEYDMENYDPYSVRVLIDNMSRNGAGATFDNVLYENIRSRALLCAAMDVTIKNCTIRGIGMAAIALIYEIDWGESGFGGNITVENNYIENTGYADNKTFYSPITMFAPAVQGGEDYFTFRNIRIEGNVVRKRGTAQALYACGVSGLCVKNNDFGDHILWEEDAPFYYSPYTDTTAALILFSEDIELSGNIYTLYNENTAAAQVCLSNTKNVFGIDVGEVADDPRLVASYQTTAYANHEPMKNPSGGLTFTGGWDMGYIGSAMKYTAFNTLGGDVWYSYNGTPWDIGGIAANYREYRYILHSSAGVGIRYTMDADATVAFSISRFYPPYTPMASAISGGGGALFAIFVNGEMVFPYEGGSYSNDNDWYFITKDTSHAELDRVLSELRLSLSEGDEILFVGRRMGDADSMFTLAPVVHYLKEN